jgi:hypothetical protein
MEHPIFLRIQIDREYNNEHIKCDVFMNSKVYTYWRSEFDKCNVVREKIQDSDEEQEECFTEWIVRFIFQTWKITGEDKVYIIN